MLEQVLQTGKLTIDCSWSKLFSALLWLARLLTLRRFLIRAVTFAPMLTDDKQ